MSLSVQHLQYQFDKYNTLLKDVSFTLRKGEKAAIVGRNGSGKSTLLQIVAGKLEHSHGLIEHTGNIYFVPQHYGQFDELSVGEALGVSDILQALDAIELGSDDPRNYELAENNWDLNARIKEAFERWELHLINLQQPIKELSGGMKTKLFLSGIELKKSSIILLDEPTNHLDLDSRNYLYRWVRETKATLLITSHDRELLRNCEIIYELSEGTITSYGGGYELYEELKELEISSREKMLSHYQKSVKEAKLKKQDVLERKQRADAQASRKARNSSDPKILLNTRKGKAATSTSKLKAVHEEKLEGLKASEKEAHAALQVQKIMKGFFQKSPVHDGKILIEADEINLHFAGGENLWKKEISVTVRTEIG